MFVTGFSLLIRVLTSQTLCALMVYRTCLAAELPTALKSRMMLNIMVRLRSTKTMICAHGFQIDFAVGLIPVLGDIAGKVELHVISSNSNVGPLY